jgi:hypothetical protein
MLVGLLGDMHREHLKLVREELEQIRRLNQEMVALRARLTRPALPAPAAGDPDAGPARADEGAEVEAGPDEAPTDRPDPQLVQAFVGERLAAWELERQSRWQKVLNLLVKNS